MNQEQRIFTRVPFDRSVRWIDAQGDTGLATACDFSRGGLSIELARFLRPGPVLSLVFDDVCYDGAPVELDAEVAWCRPAVDDPGRFIVGFSFVCEEYRALALISEVFYAALHELAAN